MASRRNFAVAERDHAVSLLALAEESASLVPHWQIVDRMWNVYIRVDDADAIYAEVQERGAGIDYTIYALHTGSVSSASRIPTATASPLVSGSSAEPQLANV
jgi:hypothetical protein